MKKHTKDSVQNCSTGTMRSVKGSTISLDGLLECSVSVEKLDMDELNKSNAANASNVKHESPVKSPVKLPVESTAPQVSQEQKMKAAHSESVVVNMDIDTFETMAPPNGADTVPDHIEMVYSDAVNMEPDLQLNYEQNDYFYETEHFNEMFESSLRMNFDQNDYNYNLNQDPMTVYSEIDPNFPVKTEKIYPEPNTLQQEISNDSMIYEILDSDEEEALNSRDSGRETNDTIIDTDSSHIPTMGVLMMAKK